MVVALRWLGQALLLTLASSLLGLLVNAVRADGLPLLAERPYEIYTDCPELTAQATPLAAAEASGLLGAVQVIDARSQPEFAAGHAPGAISLPYSALAPPDAARIAPLKGFGPGRILVVGDTELDSGQLLAADLASAGLNGVRFVAGGFAAWRAAGLPVEGAP